MRARCEAATPGPWTINTQSWATPMIMALDHSLFSVYEPLSGNKAQSMADATFAAHARQDIPALLDALEVAERLLSFEAKESIKYVDIRDQLAADRDRWKARAEALERAIIKEYFCCVICKHYSPNDMLNCALGDGYTYCAGDLFEFDEARFASKENTEAVNT